METKPVTYTQEFVEAETRSMLNEVLRDKDIVFILQLFEGRTYSYKRWSEWTTNFKDCQEISDIISKIEDILQSRINVGAINGRLNAQMVIFNLKNKYGWKDETQHKNEHTFTNLSEEAKSKLNNLIDDNPASDQQNGGGDASGTDVPAK